MNLSGPKSNVVHGGVLPCSLGRLLQLEKRPNAETAWQNTFVDYLFDFGPDKLKRNLLYERYTP